MSDGAIPLRRADALCGHARPLQARPDVSAAAALREPIGALLRELSAGQGVRPAETALSQRPLSPAAHLHSALQVRGVGVIGGLVILGPDR